MALTGYEKPLDQYTREELVEIATSYFVTYKTAAGNTSTSYNRLPKSKLIQIIKKDYEYIDANPKKPKRKKGKGASSDRIRPILNNILGVENPDDLMNEIITAIKDTNVGMTPTPGNYYTYIYYAKTPRITYDRYPLIRYCPLLPKGFVGFNYHLGEMRQYNTNDGERLVSGLYQINEQEFESLRRIPYGKLIKNP
jgi:hypothetical protein